MRKRQLLTQRYYQCFHPDQPQAILHVLDHRQTNPWCTRRVALANFVLLVPSMYAKVARVDWVSLPATVHFLVLCVARIDDHGRGPRDH